MTIGCRKGDGLLTIARIWECINKNCLYCKDAADQCQTCKSGYYIYNGDCVINCPSNSYKSGVDCIDCSSSC